MRQYKKVANADIASRIKKYGINIPVKVTPDMVQAILEGMGDTNQPRLGCVGKRTCEMCGKVLSRYNAGKLCFSCSNKNRFPA